MQGDLDHLSYLPDDVRVHARDYDIILARDAAEALLMLPLG